MLIFIDESGDTGFKFNGGSTNYFVISAVIFKDNTGAAMTATAIKDLKCRLGFSPMTEFKFNGSRRTVVVDFLRAVNTFNFRISSLIIDKRLLDIREIKENRQSFYNQIVKKLLIYLGDSIKETHITIDGQSERLFRQSFLAYLKQATNLKQMIVFKKCRLINSKSETLIQLADMVAGSTRCYFEAAKTDHQVYRNIFKRHIDHEWLWNNKK